MEIIVPPQATGNVPAFLAKLWKMVDNPDTDELIAWSDEGTSFIIKNQPEFASSLLPYYYKHSNMASFVRQLNMYGFHKVMSVESGGLKGDREEIEFAHLFFLRGQEHLLDQIKRKVSSNSKSGGINQQFVPRIKSEKVVITQIPSPEVTQREELVNEFLCEVGQLKDRQEDMDGKLDTMRTENEALWGEVLNLRQKHTQQQKIVNKLIQFLVALVQPRMGTGIKRRFRPGVQGLQLAIEEASPKAKEPRLEQTEEGPVIQEISEEMTGAKLSDLLSRVPVGSVHEITVNAPVSSAEDTESNPQVFSMDLEPEARETENSHSKYRMVDPASVTPSLTQLKKENDLTRNKRQLVNREISKEDFDTDISSMQKELDSLKEILSGQITLDTSLVSNLFSPDQENISCMNLFNENLLNQEEETNLSEDNTNDLKLVTYNPSLFELAEEQAGSIGVDEEDLMHTPPKVQFEMELHTPTMRDSSQDLMQQFFVK